MWRFFLIQDEVAFSWWNLHWLLPWTCGHWDGATLDKIQGMSFLGLPKVHISKFQMWERSDLWPYLYNLFKFFHFFFSHSPKGNVNFPAMLWDFKRGVCACVSWVYFWFSVMLKGWPFGVPRQWAKLSSRTGTLVAPCHLWSSNLTGHYSRALII